MKKKVYPKVITIIFTLIGLAGGLIYSNHERIFYPQRFDISISMDNVEFINWISKGDNSYVSQEDPQIIIFNKNQQTAKEFAFLGNIEATGDATVFYAEGDDTFSEEQSMASKIDRTAQGFAISINLAADVFRIDLTEEPGVIMELSEIILNPSRFSINISITGMAALFGLICSLPFYFSLAAVKKIPALIENFKHFWYMLYNLVRRDFTIKYRRSVLGVVWSILNPLLMMMVLSAVFQTLFRGNIENFPIYYLTGSLIYNFVVEATNGAMTSVLGSGALIKKVYIPKYIFPLEKCLFSILNLLFSMLALVVMMFFLRFVPNWTVLLIPIPIVYTFVFSLGFGMILATLNTFFRDVSHLYGVFTTAWVYLTPIIYPVDILPDIVLSFVKLNPLYYYVEYFRQLVMYGTVPSLTMNLYCAFFSLSFLILGVAIFKKQQDKFILYI